MQATAALLPCGQRLHLHHGPIDLIIGAEGDRARAFEAAQARFASVLTELMAELPLLRTATSAPRARGAIARRMQTAVAPLAPFEPVTPMAAVAGSVAEEILAAMTTAADLTRAYVNNGGDIAIHLTPDAQFTMAMAAHDGAGLGRIRITHADPVRGIATSGRHGRSHSLGIADSVTVLAATASVADAAATLIANAVDLPGHPAIRRTPANQLTDDSDLGTRPVVTGCGALTPAEIDRALTNGAARARAIPHIAAASLHLAGQSRTIGARALIHQESPEHA
ncbi:UPF0280 family protein [Sulfitobacter albidus]|uniref:UPF0280 family protein n=1 Tax=Sulfitobacter albidus TaxID=2829501 RepID=A0A975JDJ0_9RHOB|nr:UPF0280 family protein [Sulfitobacter albidus]QUJ76377.1 UPF0280 family protein [Sulfitobacter albidus]